MTFIFKCSDMQHLISSNIPLIFKRSDIQHLISLNMTSHQLKPTYPLSANVQTHNISTAWTYPLFSNIQTYISSDWTWQLISLNLHTLYLQTFRHTTLSSAWTWHLINVNIPFIIKHSDTQHLISISSDLLRLAGNHSQPNKKTQKTWGETKGDNARLTSSQPGDCRFWVPASATGKVGRVALHCACVCRGQWDHWATCKIRFSHGFSGLARRLPTYIYIYMQRYIHT